MSDKKEKAPTPKQIADLINRKAADATCSYCKSKDLQLMVVDGKVTEYALYVWGTLGTAMPLYIVGCSNCGHPHFFSKKMIDDMVRAEWE